MTGRVINVLPRTKLDFSFAGASPVVTEVQLATGIDVSSYREIVLYVRTHALTVVSSWFVLPTLNVFVDGYTDEDATAGAAGTNVQAQFISGPVATLGMTVVSAPALQTLPVPASVGSLLLLTLQLRPKALAQYTAWISIDLSGKA